MKKELLNDCVCALNNAQINLAKIAEIESVRERFQSGEPLKLTVTCGETEICDRLLLANGKALFMQDVLNAFALQAELSLKTELSTVQDLLEIGGGK